MKRGGPGRGRSFCPEFPTLHVSVGALVCYMEICTCIMSCGVRCDRKNRRIKGTESNSWRNECYFIYSGQGRPFSEGRV